MGDTNTYGDAEKFNPVDYYAKSLKDRVRDAAGKFIDRLTDLLAATILTPEEQALFAARTPDYIYGLELLASRGLVAAQNTLNKHTKP